MLRLAFVVSVVFLTFAACGDDDGASERTVTPSVGEVSLLPVGDTITLLGADPEDAAAGLATGDFNGDGALDILLGAAFADGPSNAREDAGEALVFLGPFQRGETRDAGAGEMDLVIYGGEIGDQAGRAVAAADVNGDSIDDIVVGVPFADGPGEALVDAGGVSVILGSSEIGRSIDVFDLNDGADVAISGPSAGALTGFSLASGHLNDDAYDDLVIGSFQGDGGSGLSRAGTVHAILGSTAPPPTIDLSQDQADVTVYGPSPDAWLGETVNTGDFDGDGLDDLLLTAAFAPSLDGEDAGGQVSVILSPPPGVVDLSTEVADYTIYGAGEGDQIGHSSATGDIDGDGLDDILLGAVSSDGEEDAVNLAGEAVVVTASALKAAVDVASGDATAIAYGTATADRLGRSVALGDIDGDGLVDLILGLPGADSRNPTTEDTGALYVVHGAAVLAPVIELPADGQPYFSETGGAQLTNGVEGRPALASSDVDGDGRDEILVSSSDGGVRQGSGIAYVLFVER